MRLSNEGMELSLTIGNGPAAPAFLFVELGVLLMRNPVVVRAPTSCCLGGIRSSRIAAARASAEVNTRQRPEEITPILSGDLWRGRSFRRVLASWALRVLNPCAGDGEFGIDVSGGVQTEVPDFHEATRQNVEEKPAHEFQGEQVDRLACRGCGRRLRRHRRGEAVVGDGDPVGVETEVAEEGVGFRNGAFA